MKNRISLILLGIPCFIPMFWRLFHNGFSEPIGLLSDGAMGLTVYLIAVVFPHWLRIILISAWALFQTGAWELFGAMQRFPSWEDLHYLTDASFVEKSASGLNFSYPYLAAALFAAVVTAGFFAARRPGRRLWLASLATTASLLLLQGYLSHRHDNQSMAARYNPLQWIVQDAAFKAFQPEPIALKESDLPAGLRQTDLTGNSLLARKGAAKNVLIVVLEGIPGLYYPEISKAMGGESSDAVVMQHFADTAKTAMLIPDFVTHSHQTIRGLYAILCGDFSKLSNETPKAFEIQQNPERAKACLPARMAQNGWSTHYLQAANLMFMGKDRFMPAIGFQHVHGVEWFKESNPYPFPWGVIDPVFFRGARQYIKQLQSVDKPWMLTLLTVGTHQPYAVPDEIAKKYASRKLATVGILDQAVGEFIDGLRRDGVLDETLVILTSDESHGSTMAEWVSSWGLGVILAPKKDKLPRMKQGTFGLLDIAPSVLDYLGLEVPSSLIGRSFFRDYKAPREMVSYTAGKLRWHTADNMRYECAYNGGCRAGQAESILGYPPKELEQVPFEDGERLWAMAAALDHKLTSQEDLVVLKFADGEIRKLPEKLFVESEWSENLAGAQYLNFPAGSEVHVSIKIKAVQAPPEGIQLNLYIRQYEILTKDIAYPEFPLLRTGEEAKIEFKFDNPKPRKTFSFHLVGAGKNARVQMQEFNVTIDRRKDKPSKS